MIKAVEKIVAYVKDIWKNESNRTIIKDVALLSVATIVFHFIYWTSDMSAWIFGAYTNDVYDFFKIIAFKGSNIMLKNLTDISYYIGGTTYYFYDLLPNGDKSVVSTMEVSVDCSGVKQLLQFLLIMVLCRGVWWGKGVYFLIGSVSILFFNAVRIFVLTYVFAANPDIFQSIHDWIARPMMYMVIFMLWLVWIEYLAKRQKKTKPQG